MAEKISKNIIVVILALLASVVGIVSFVSGKNLPEMIGSSEAPETVVTSEASETSSAEEKVELTGSIVHFPDTADNDYVVGGVWKLQGVHKAAYQFSQNVEIYSVDAPKSLVFSGAASYDMVWCENPDGTWVETPSDFDEITQYDYPSGTYGTFYVDMSGKEIPEGRYNCRIGLMINARYYVLTIPFEL